MHAPITRAKLIEFDRLLEEGKRRLARKQQSRYGYYDENGVRQGGLIAFVRYFWSILEPETPFIDGWPLWAMCEHLESVTSGKINRLLINIPPGCMKPVHINELIMTDRGFVRLGEIDVGDKVLTGKGRFRAVTAVHEQGVLPLVKITTNGGRCVRTAADHPFLTPRGWVKAGELTDQDYVGIPHLNEEFGDRLMKPEEARLLGYLVGDGCISQRSLAFVSADEESIADFIACAKAMGFYAYVTVHPNERVKARKVVLKSSEDRFYKKGEEPPVLQWLNRHRLYRSNSYTKRIPCAVFRSGSEALANFVGAYWSCDGCIYVRHQTTKTTLKATATTVSEELAADLQRALMCLGICSRVRRRAVELPTEAQGDVYVSWEVLTSERNEVAKIARLPGLLGRKRKLAEVAFLDRFAQPIYEDAVMSVEQDGEGECRCLTVDEDSTFTVNGLIVHNSLLVNVFWPAWEWGPMGKSHLRYVTFSYSASLTERDNGKFRDLVTSESYRHLYGRGEKGVQLRNKTTLKVHNSRTGWKLASSVGGVGTGERGDRIILDDPHNVKDVESETVRTETTRWFRESLSSRFNNERTAFVVIMQRVHEDDVSGVILSPKESGETLGYCHLMIPMKYDWERQTDPDNNPRETDIGWTDPRYSENADECDNELAWPERFSEETCHALEVALGPYAWAGQYLQAPAPRGGGLFKSEWWQLWPDSDGKFPHCDYVIASLDGAFTEKEENDPSALTVWGTFVNEHHQRRIILLNAWRKHLRFSGPRVDRLHEPTKIDDRIWPPDAVNPDMHPDLVRHRNELYRRRCMQSWGLIEHVADTCRRFKVNTLLIEGAATGISAAQELGNRHGQEGWSIQVLPARGDKVARALAAQPVFSQLMVYAPDREWAQMVIDEMAVFPRGKYDDLTDSATQAINYLRSIGLASSDVETEAAVYEGVRHKRKMEAIYPV